MTSSRMNLGKYQPDGVIMDLAPHDLSILLYWLEQPIVEVAATARSIFQAEIPETAFITLTFEGGAQANVQISWLAPRKVREMTIVGSRRMVQYDDTLTDEPVRVYDRGMEFSTPANFGEYQLTYRTGDMVVPRVDAAEPLSLELQDFAQRDPHRKRAPLQRAAGPADRGRHGSGRDLPAPPRRADRDRRAHARGSLASARNAKAAPSRSPALRPGAALCVVGHASPNGLMRSTQSPSAG